MAVIATVVQEFNQFNVELPPTTIDFDSPVTAGGALIGFETWLGPGGTGGWQNIISGPGTWTNLPGLGFTKPLALAFGVGYPSGTVGISYARSGPGPIFLDSNQVGIEVSVANAFDAANLESGDGTLITANLTTQDGRSYSLTTANTYPDWNSYALGLTRFDQAGKDFKIIFAFLQTSDPTLGGIVEVIPGWTHLMSSVNYGIYYQTDTSQQQQFQYPSGAPVANGYLLINLDTDVQIPSSDEQVVGSRVVKVQLDANGFADNFILFSNADAVPDSSYIVRVYSPGGELIRGPYQLQVTDSWL